MMFDLNSEAGRIVNALADERDRLKARVAELEAAWAAVTLLVEPDDDGTRPLTEWDAWPKRLDEDQRMSLAEAARRLALPEGSKDHG